MATWSEVIDSLGGHPSAAVVLVVAVATVAGASVRPVCRLLGLRSCLRLLQHLIDHGHDASTVADAAAAMAVFQQSDQMKAIAEASKQAAEKFGTYPNTPTSARSGRLAAALQKLAIAMASWRSHQAREGKDRR